MNQESQDIASNNRKTVIDTINGAKKEEQTLEKNLINQLLSIASDSTK